MRARRGLVPAVIFPNSLMSAPAMKVRPAADHYHGRDFGRGVRY